MVNEENQVEGDVEDYVDDNDGGEKERTEDSDYAEYAEEDDDDKEDDDDEDDDDDVPTIPDDSFSSISTLTLDNAKKNDDDDEYEAPRREKPEDLNRSSTPEGQQRLMRTRSHSTNTGESLINDDLLIYPLTGFERRGARGGRGRTNRGRGRGGRNK